MNGSVDLPAGSSGFVTGLNDIANNPGVAALTYARVLANVYAYQPRIPDPAKAPRDDPSFWRKALRDPTIRKAVMRRTYAVAGKKWTVTPGGEKTDGDKTAATILESALKKIKRFDQSRALVASAIFRGQSYAYIQGERQLISLGKDTAGKPLPPRWWWVPTELLDVDPYRFELRRDPTDGRPKWYMASVNYTFASANPRALFDNWEPLDHPEWFCRHVYEPTEQSLRYGQGLQDALEFPLWAKQDLWRNFLCAARRAGRGFFDVATNDLRAGSTTEEMSQRINDWKTALETVREDGDLIRSPEDTVQLLPMPIEGLEIIRDQIRDLNADMTSLILFGVNPTGGGKGGSYGQAEEEGAQGREAFHFDQAGLSESITESVVALTWNLNKDNFAALGLGDATMGVFEIVNDQKPDPKAMAGVVATLVAAGANLREDEVLDRCGGWTPPKNGEKTLKPSQGALPSMPFGATPASGTDTSNQAANPSSPASGASTPARGGAA